MPDTTEPPRLDLTPEARDFLAGREGIDPKYLEALNATSNATIAAEWAEYQRACPGGSLRDFALDYMETCLTAEGVQMGLRLDVAQELARSKRRTLEAQYREGE